LTEHRSIRTLGYVLVTPSYGGRPQKDQGGG
jgi:hypothetical protein